MPTKVLPRKGDDLKLQYALKDQDGAFLSLSGASVVCRLLRPTSGIVTQDSVSIIGSPTTHSVEIVFGKAKMTDVGLHKAQVEVTLADTTVKHSEIDIFNVMDNLA